MRSGRQLGGRFGVAVGTKNKGGKNVKTVAARDLKQKRRDKKTKKDAAQGKQSGLIREHG